MWKDLEINFFPQIIQEGSFFRYKDYLLPINYFESAVFYYNLGIEYLSDLEKLKGKDFIDAGAYIGDSAIVLNQLKPRKIYAFEPVSLAFCNMLKTITLNKLDNIIEPVKMGLYSDSSESKIYVNCNNGFCSSLKEDAAGAKEDIIVEELIKVTTIDKFTEENNLQIGLIKADTEGAAFQMLKGAEKTIKTQKPALILGIYHNIEEFFEVKPLIESWDLGYKFKVVKLNPFSLVYETTLICEVY